MKAYKFVFFAVLSMAMSLSLQGYGAQIKVNGIQSKVQKVVSGNVIELQNGLKVEILGIKPSEHTKEYLEREVKGEVVILVSDSRQPQFISTYMTTVKAYVKVKGSRLCVSGMMLSNRIADLRQTFVTDSIASFKKYAYAEGQRSAMSETELYTYMRPATFMIVRDDGGVGTGFFINEKGLALTNNHVYDGSVSAKIMFFDSNGHANENDCRNIDRVLYTEEGRYVDYTVFQVRLNGDEKVKYMPLISQHEKEGQKIAKLGCPVGQTCNFQVGILSQYVDGHLVHSIQSNHGDSGGPVVNYRGEVIGVNQSIEFNPVLGEQAKGIANAVDAVLIREMLDKKGIQYGR